MRSVELQLKKELTHQNLQLGAPVFIRIFKVPARLEVWLENENKQFQLFKTYKICKYSGNLGPKTREGDLQAPEGFYYVKGEQLNPWSSYHLSFNLGYPNAYDRSHGRSGSALMVHGNCVSIGCYAMSDARINEIYTLAYKALENGQDFFRVHIFPFKLESARFKNHQNNKWYSFWLNLKEGYDYFLEHKRPPDVGVKNKKYTFSKDHE